MRRKITINLWGFFHWLERKVVRVLILGAVLLAIIQLSMGLAADPVDFYLAVSKQVESPPLELVDSEQRYQIKLQAIPAAPVKIYQNGRLMGDLATGEKEFNVKTGNLLLDGRYVDHPVKIWVKECDPHLNEPRLNQTFIVESNVIELSIIP